MVPFDVDALLRAHLAASRRPPDGLLHCSGDLCGSLRHSQLRAAGAPTIESDLISDVRMQIGTDTHHRFERIFRGKPVMLEVKLDPWLPAGWSGTADWIVWDADRRAFVLGDLKTIKPEGMAYINSGGIKDEHMHQLSAYWYALERMGIPLVRGFAVYYLPTGQLVGDRVEPSLQEGTPLDETYMCELMESRWAATKDYLEVISGRTRYAGQPPEDVYVNGYLAPVQDRETRLLWNKAASKAGGKETAGFEVKLVPHWSTSYCPFPLELCDCRTQGVTKLGTWFYDAETGAPQWKPARGMDGAVNPRDVFPDDAQLKRLKEAHDAGSGT